MARHLRNGWPAAAFAALLWLATAVPAAAFGDAIININATSVFGVCGGTAARTDGSSTPSPVNNCGVGNGISYTVTATSAGGSWAAGDTCKFYHDSPGVAADQIQWSTGAGTTWSPAVTTSITSGAITPGAVGTTTNLFIRCTNGATIQDYTNPRATPLVPPTFTFKLTTSQGAVYSFDQSYAGGNYVVSMGASDTYSISWAWTNVAATQCFVSSSQGFVWQNTAANGNSGSQTGITPTAGNSTWGESCAQPYDYLSVGNGFLIQAWPAGTVSISAPASGTVGTPFTLNYGSNPYVDLTTCTVSGPGYSKTPALAYPGDYNSSTGMYASSGSITPSAAGNAVYTIGCTGLDKHAYTAQTTVNVTGQPSAAISVNPTQVTVGSPYTVTWSSSNVTSCSVTGAGWAGSSLTSGSQQFTPVSGGNVSYSISCTGIDGQTYPGTATEIVNAPAPTATISTSPTSSQVGGSYSVIWSSTNTSSCSVTSSPAGFAGSGTSSSGQTVTPASSGSWTYTLSCLGIDGSTKTATATETVTYPPAVLSLTASPTAVMTNGSFSLTWAATNAASCSVSSSPSGFVGSGANGSSTIQPTSSGTYSYTFLCTGMDGLSYSKSASVSVTDMQCDFAISPDTVDIGTTSFADWATNISDGCELTGQNIDGATGSSTVAYPSSGEATLGPYSSAGTYVFNFSCPRAATGPALCSATGTLTVVDPVMAQQPALPPAAPVIAGAANPGNFTAGASGLPAMSGTGLSDTVPGALRSVQPYDFSVFCNNGAKTRTAAWMAACNSGR